MPFQAYLDNIKIKTGESAAELVKLAAANGVLNNNTKAADLVKWLKGNFDLGHGHSMAIWKFIQDNKPEISNKKISKKATGKTQKGLVGKTANSKIKTENLPTGQAGSPQQTVDSYIAGFPAKTQALLEKMRATIKKAAPAAEETMGYGIPTFKLNGNLVHYAGYKNHIGFYPAPSAIKKFEKELRLYEGAKGSVQFPLTTALPLALVTKIVKFRVKENEAINKK